MDNIEGSTEFSKSQIKLKTTSITDEAIAQLPVVQFQGNIKVIDQIQKFKKVIDEIKSYELLGFDTESKPSFKRGQQNKISLLQLASDDVCYLFRLNKIGLPSELIEILSENNIKKVGLSLHDDFRELMKIIKFTPRNFIDLQQMIEQFGIKEKSLKKLTALVLGYRISKRQQTSNWESATLSEAQLIYAATDAWICLEIYKKLISL